MRRSCLLISALLGGIVALVSVNLVSNDAAAFHLRTGEETEAATDYREGEPFVKYHCFEQNEDGSYNKTAEGYLIPCPIDHGDNAWMLTSSALVLMMTPAGLAFFYGGLSRQKNAVNSLHMVFITTGVVAVQFTLIGYSLAFGPDAGGGGIFMSVLLGGVVNVFDVFC